MGRRSSIEEGVDPKERRAAKDCADVVGISHAVERDGGGAIHNEQIGEIVRRQPRAWTGEYAETLVMGGPRQSIEIRARHFLARHVASRCPPDEFLDLDANGGGVCDANDIVRTSSKQGEPRAKPVDPIFRCRSV
jgi:hypothetical protein